MIMVGDGATDLQARPPAKARSGAVAAGAAGAARAAGAAGAAGAGRGGPVIPAGER